MGSPATDTMVTSFRLIAMVAIVGIATAGCGSSKARGQTGIDGAATGGGTAGIGGGVGGIGGVGGRATGGVGSGGFAAGGATTNGGVGAGGAGLGGAGTGGGAGRDGGSGTGGSAGRDGGGSGGAVDAGRPPDGSDARDTAADEHDGPFDLPTSVCPTAVMQGSAKTSSSCSISPFAVDAAAVCGSAAGCPITSAYSLHCSDSNSYGPWLVPNGAAGASVLLATGNPTSRLFTIGAGAVARADDLPDLIEANESLAVERDGTRVIFTGEMPGLWRARETAAGWATDEATTVVGTDLAIVSAGWSLDETHAFAAYFNLDDNIPRLATRDGSCWSTMQLGTMDAQAMAMDVDATNRPWVAWLGNGSALPTLMLAGPDGSSYVPWTGTTGYSFSFWYPPIVLAGGLGGSDALPALGVQQADGLHVITPNTGTAGWADHVVPGSKEAQYTGNCPASGPVTTGPACQGLTSCTEHGAGALSGFGLVRTSSGRAYAGWLEVDYTSTHALTQSPTLCTSGATPCICQSSVTSSTRMLTLVLARVTNSATSDQSVRRFPLDTSTAANIMLPQFFSLVMAARGDTVLAVAKLSVSPDSQLLYLELDSSLLP